MLTKAKIVNFRIVKYISNVVTWMGIRGEINVNSSYMVRIVSVLPSLLLIV